MKDTNRSTARAAWRPEAQDLNTFLLVLLLILMLVGLIEGVLFLAMSRNGKTLDATYLFQVERAVLDRREKSGA